MERIELFATPVVLCELPDVVPYHGELVERLIAEARGGGGLARSNAGGFHSRPDLSQRPEACFQALMQAICDRAAALVERLLTAAGKGPPAGHPGLTYGLTAWAMVMRDGDYAVPHDHGDSHFSSAYYLDAGDADEVAHPRSGVLSLVDPRRAGRSGQLGDGLDLFPSTFSVRPRTGLLVLFPGYLQHYVEPYRGSRPRVCVACNVTVGTQWRGPA